MGTLLSIALYLLVATAMVAFILAVRSIRLRMRFERMGKLPGRSLADISKFAGKPSHTGRMPDGREFVEWQRIGFHIALTFKDGVCDSVAYLSTNKG